MHWRTAVVPCLALMLAGCAGPTSGGEAEPRSDDVRQGRVDESPPEVRDVRLGRAVGGGEGPARIPLALTVPVGGATSIRWYLTMAPVSSMEGHIEGPGCVGNGRFVNVGTSMDTQGECNDLAEGEHEFTIVLTEPVLEWDAVVHGLGAGEAASGNATDNSRPGRR